MTFIKLILCTCILCCLSVGTYAQSTGSLTVSNHPSVSRLNVQYDMTLNQSTPVLSPNIAVVLKPGVTVSELWLTMLRKQDSTVLYQVSYAINAAPVTDSTGRQRFFIKGLQPVISVPQAFPLDTYIYKVYTKDPQGVQSPEFISKQ
jgi:hypothetical protein